MTFALSWEALTAIGTFAMAVGTLAMVITTVIVIFQNKRHHQDTFKPACVLVLNGGVDRNTRGNALQLQRNFTAPDICFFVQCSMKNVGTGPALNLRLGVRFPDKAGYLIWSELPPLGANRRSKSPLMIPVVFGGKFNETDYKQAPGGLWELWLFYEDVFGNVFHTKHAKDPHQPWAVLGKGGVL